MELGQQSAASAAAQDLDLANAELDLSSWLFDDADDLYQPDFGNGAKEMHSISSGATGFASPSFNSGKLPDWMENTSDLKLDMPFPLEDYFTEIKKIQPVDQLPTKFEPHFFMDHEDFQKTEMQQLPKDIFQHDVAQVLYQEDSEPSTSATIEEVVDTHCYDNSQGQFDVAEEVINDSNTPSIISVPLTDAFIDHKPVFKTINIASTQAIDRQTPAAAVSTQKGCQPHKIVINLKRVSLPNKAVIASSPAAQSLAPEAPKPTLKEVLNSGNAEDFIRELVNIPAETSFKDSAMMQSDSEESSSNCYSPVNSGAMDCLSPASSFAAEEEGCEQQLGSIGGSRSSRFSPYSLQEKKLRKKEQNKRAALRYRLKKKEEEDSMLAILKKEQEKEKELTATFTALKMEVHVMKKLMRDLLAAQSKQK